MDCIVCTLRMHTAKPVMVLPRQVKSVMAVKGTRSSFAVHKPVASQLSVTGVKSKLLMKRTPVVVLSHLCPDSSQSCFGGGYYVESSPWSESEAYSE